MTAQAQNQKRRQGHTVIVEMCKVVVKFARSFWSNSSDYVARLGINMTEYTPEMEFSVPQI